MIVFKDIYNKDDCLTNAYNIKDEYDGSIMSVASRMVNPDDLGKVDIGCGNAFGGNEEEQVENDGVEKVNNIINANNLVEFFGSKNDVKEYLKVKIADMKERLKDNPDRLKLWEKGGGVEDFVKNFFGIFEQCQFYMGQSYSNDEPREGMLIVSYWVDEEKDVGPTFFFFKDCYKEEKC